MNRRTLLAGLCTAASGSGLVLGSGAFTQVSTARNVTIAVDNDSDALIELTAGDPSPVAENASGELEISTENFGGAFNEDATVEIGDTGNPSETPAFSVTNNFDESIDLTIDLQNLDSSGNFTLYFDKTGFDSPLAANEKTNSYLGSDTTLNIAIKIDTQSPGSNFNGTIRIDASVGGS